jgi:enterochelin esterase family protein
MSAVADGPVVGDASVALRVPDPDRALAAVRLHQGVERPREGPAFAWQEDAAAWTLEYPRRGLMRLEYRIERTGRDGAVHLGPDPLNPRTAPGSRSAVEFPGYRPPAWLDGAPPDAGSEQTVSLRSRLLGAEVPARLWTPPGHDARAVLPLLVVHDGPDYADQASLLRLLALRVADGTLPPHRAALLHPVDRDEAYAASPRYARALVEELLPVLDQLAPTPPDRQAWVGLGASLGALALLFAHRAHPGTFGGLVLQSGSFFHLHADRHEARFRRYGAIRDFVEGVVQGRGTRDPVPVVMTVGALEENRANNRAVHDALRRQGYPVELHETADLHNWTAWRDVLDARLVPLLRALWSPSG